MQPHPHSDGERHGGERHAGELGELLATARLLALDVDGVLTDGSIVYTDAGELQSFSVLDGIAIGWLRAVGVEVAWISGRGCAATAWRAGELGIAELHLKVGDKRAALADLQERLGVGPEHTIAMGDDLPDLAMASRAALFAAPANARPEVRARAALVTEARGGAGAVRELAERILVARGAWAGIAGRFEP